MEQHRSALWQGAKRDYAMALYAGGATMEEVGTTLGVSRERVRQLLKDCGVRGRPSPKVTDDPASAVAALRRSHVTSWEAWARELGSSSTRGVRRMAWHLGLTPAANRLFQWRRFWQRSFAADCDWVRVVAVVADHPGITQKDAATALAAPYVTRFSMAFRAAEKAACIASPLPRYAKQRPWYVTDRGRRVLALADANAGAA